MAGIAIALLFVLPIYNIVFNLTNRIQLVRWITLFFVANILVFYCLVQSGVSIGFVFFVWVGVFGVLMISQFWAYAADSFNVKSGQRLFPIIMIGAGLGGLVGSQLTKVLVVLQGPSLVLLTAAIILGITLVITNVSRRTIPAQSLCVDCHIKPSKFQNILGGMALVFQRRYLWLIAIYVVILNCINSTGEYILSKHVVAQAEQMLADGGTGLDLSGIITTLYSDFYFWVTLVGLLFQAFLVSRVYALIGVSLSILVMPVFVLAGFFVIGLIPIFTIIYLFKIVENAIDYSIMNTTRQALFLPLSQEEKYHGKTAIDTFFWRFGDLVQAGLVFVGVQYLNFDLNEFIVLSAVLAIIWVWLSIIIMKLYRQLVRENASNAAPVVNIPISDTFYQPGTFLSFSLPIDTFIDPDPGDTLHYSVMTVDNSPFAWVAEISC